MKWRINLLMELRIALMLRQISVTQWLPLTLCLNDHRLRFKRSSIQLGDIIVSIIYSSNHWLPIMMCANYLIIKKWLDSSYLNNASTQRSFLTDKSRFPTGELSCIWAWCTHNLKDKCPQTFIANTFSGRITQKLKYPTISHIVGGKEFLHNSEASLARNFLDYEYICSSLWKLIKENLTKTVRKPAGGALTHITLEVNIDRSSA